MQVIECSRVGGPEVLRLGERPRPVAGAGEVLIRVPAAGLNHADLAQRDGGDPAGARDRCVGLLHRREPGEMQCLRASGCEHRRNYREQDFGAVLKERLGRNAIHVIFDMVGGDYFEKNIDLLARDGRLAYVAALGGSAVSLDLVDLMRKRLSIFGSVLRPLPVARKGEILRDMAKLVWPLLERGAFKPAIHRQFAVDRASDAHALMESHRHIGKLVLTW